MGRNEQFEGIYAREASILVSFQWEKKRFRERLELAPTAVNLRAAARLRDEITSAIRIGKFTIEDFARYFPKSKWLLDKSAHSVASHFGAVADSWLDLARAELEETTVREYENALNRYFRPVFGMRPIRSITYEDLATYVAGLPFKSAKTFNNVMTPVRRVFSFALTARKIEHDITRDIKSRKNQKAAPDPLDVSEIDAVLAHIGKKYGDVWLNYFEFAFFTGLRPSELIALRWPSVDFRRQQVRIEESRVRALDKGTKTHKGRDIDLQTRAFQALTRQKKHTYLAGEQVFINPNSGERFHDTAPPVRIVWRPTLKAVGIRDRDARQTRHSFATMCLHAGMNPAYIARQMGHTNPRMFFEVYSKWIDGDASEREKAKLDALFAAGKRDAV
ncbi:MULTISPECIES: site-specific integrase [Pandoraea]|uniref:site-specific integrase n=1 Tax=Pandoraea TaxID=93217 RepID=UPI00095DAC71|nr:MULTISPECIES: site-specific integrase [Pandoraea]MDM8358821.1 tyrosine-type recombinase/integrase [Pandoraea communis]OJY23581.1 MAG: hypothetical protein BGP02_04740 [Pandoraea sp. 64-18]